MDSMADGVGLPDPQVSVSDAELNWVSVKPLYPFPKGL